MLRKDLQEKHLHCLKESSNFDSPSDMAADSFLLSFAHNSQPAKKPESIRATSFNEASLSGKSSDDNSSEKYANHGQNLHSISKLYPTF